MNAKHKISRRNMLKMSAAGAAGAAATVLPAGMVSAGAPSQDEIVLNIDFRQYGVDVTGEYPEQGEALDAFLDSYKMMHPNVTVNHAPIDPGAWGDIQQWVARRLVAEDGPDLLFGNWTYLIEDWMKGDLVGWWDPYLESPNPYLEGNEQWADQFIKPGERQSNGMSAWLGLDNTTLWTWYNQDMFDANGWDVPTTWSEQIALYEQIAETDIIPLATHYNPIPHYAVWSFDMVGNQVLHTVFEDLAGGSESEPLPAQVAAGVLDGRYGIDQAPYQDTIKITSEWWQYAGAGAHGGGDANIPYGQFLSGQAATRYTGIWENRNLDLDMPGTENPFAWSAFPIPVVDASLSEHATGHATAAVFVAGATLFTLPAYNSGARRDATADLLKYMSVPENLAPFIAEFKGFVPNIKNTPLPSTLAGFAVPDDATYWYVNSWGGTHITQEARDAWARNWQLVLLDAMSWEEFTEIMQAELVKAAEDTLGT